ncbi:MULTISPECIES: glycosyltransferase family 4 protein [Natrialbaceae]|uniref:glycosyltransferase family 4 protein n=1 Tax=Natrialbaceae TaxID=1644061 RepID=UPI00207C495C|nr:glycosyltransferase family 4 protein [Natronococcus sp. CG52]
MTDLAVGLKERGLDIKVYTGQPNYHSGENEKQPRVSVYENTPVVRISAPQVRQSSLIRRLFNWTVFISWMFVVLLLDTSRNDREVVFVSITPFLSTVVSLACRLNGWDYTYIAYDLYPDQAAELGYVAKGGIVERLWRRVENSTLSSANNVVVNGELMKERLLENSEGRVDPTDVKIIHNWADEDFLRPMPKEENPFSREHDLVDPFTVLYSGNIGEFHDLETLIEAAARFDDGDVQFLIIGEGDKKKSLIRLAESLSILGDTVTFLPYQPWDDLPHSLTSGDVSVVTVQKGFEGVCVSSKIYSAMAAGMPILCIAQPFDDESRLVDQFDMGLHVPQGDVDGTVEAIESWRSDERLLQNQGRNARSAFEQNFTKDECIDDYYQLLTEDGR